MSDSSNTENQNHQHEIEYLPSDVNSKYGNGWKSSHLMILSFYFIVLFLGIFIFVFTRLLIGKVDFFSINYDYITQFMVPLYYIYLVVILSTSIKGRDLINYINKHKPDVRTYYDDKGKIVGRFPRFDSEKPDPQKKNFKACRIIVKKAIARETSDLIFILVAFLPVSILFYLSVLVWIVSNPFIFEADVAENLSLQKLGIENLFFVADIFTKGIFADFMEHYNISFTDWNINHDERMFSIFVLTFRTSISILFVSTIYRALSLYLRMRTFSGKKMYIASIISQLEPSKRYIAINRDFQE